jgi:HlyD family secretion protein
MLRPMPPILRSRTFVATAAIGVAALATIALVVSRGTAVDVVRAEVSRITQSVVVSGRVLAPAKSEIGSAITGRVQAVAVDEGDHVAAQALLIELEQAELVAALAQARASEAAAQTRIRQWREVGAPNAAELLAQAEANHRVAARYTQRQEELFKQGFIGEARVDEARRAVAVAKSQLETARSNAAANSSAGTERRLLDDQLTQARAAREAAAAKLAQTRIVAPAAGTILDRNVEPGDIVQPGKRLMTLAQDGPTRLTALVDEKNLALVALGQQAVAAADAFPGQRFAATLEYLSPGIDVQRGTVEAKFSVPSPPAFLRADMTVSIDIGVADKDGALVVPATAVRDAGMPEPWVLVLREGRAEKVPVRLGARSAGRAEILSGVAAGDEIIVTPAIEPGQRVRAR